MRPLWIVVVVVIALAVGGITLAQMIPGMMGGGDHMGPGMMGRPGGGMGMGRGAAPAADGGASGQALYELNCASCHGRDARGDGPAAGTLHPRPPDLYPAPLEVESTHKP